MPQRLPPVVHNSRNVTVSNNVAKPHHFDAEGKEHDARPLPNDTRSPPPAYCAPQKSEKPKTTITSSQNSRNTDRELLIATLQRVHRRLDGRYEMYQKARTILAAKMWMFWGWYQYSSAGYDMENLACDAESLADTLSKHKDSDACERVMNNIDEVAFANKLEEIVSTVEEWSDAIEDAAFGVFIEEMPKRKVKPRLMNENVGQRPGSVDRDPLEPRRKHGHLPEFIEIKLLTRKHEKYGKMCKTAATQCSFLEARILRKRGYELTDELAELVKERGLRVSD